MSRKFEFLIGAAIGPMLGVTFMLVLFGACNPSADPEDVQVAMDSANEVLSYISVPLEAIEVLKIHPEDFDDGEHRQWGERACAFSRRYVVLGSTQPINGIVQAYSARLEEIGFERRGGQHVNSATLYRGDSDSVDIGYLPSFTWYVEAEEQDRWRIQYATVARLKLEAVAPGLSLCEQWSNDAQRTPYAVPTITPAPE
jgi:hypothetical protein